MARFNVQRALQSGYSQQEINNYLRSRPDLVASTASFGEKLVRGKTAPIVGSILGGTIGSLVGPAGLAVGAGGGYAGGEAVRSMISKLMGYEGGISQLPTQKQVGETLGESGKSAATALALYGAGKVISPALTTGKAMVSQRTLSPSKALYGEMQKRAAQAGTVPEEALRRVVGTSAVPNPELYRGLGPGFEETGLRKLLGREIANIGTGAPGDITGASYQRLLDLRKGAYAASKVAPEKLAYAGQKGAVANLGRAYSKILKEGVSGMGGLDKAYSTLNRITSGAKGAGRATMSALKWIILYRILSGSMR